MTISGGPTEAAFAAFMTEVEPRLRRALVATLGPVDGRQAAHDALSWAWEHWEVTQNLGNPAAYLYRVGCTAARRIRVRPLPAAPHALAHMDVPTPAPELVPALLRLSEQQRAVVVLVHGFGWSQREVASMLDISISTTREHLRRAMDRLRRELEDDDAD